MSKAAVRKRTPKQRERKEISGRDDRGRFIKGLSANPKGRPPITPELKAVRALAEVHRESNVEKLVQLRDTSPDPWVVIEAIKLLLQYSDGKPVTAHTGAPLINLNVLNSSNSGSAALSPEAAYRAMVEGVAPLDPKYFLSKPGDVLDAELVEEEA